MTNALKENDYNKAVDMMPQLSNDYCQIINKVKDCLLYTSYVPKGVLSASVDNFPNMYHDYVFRWQDS